MTYNFINQAEKCTQLLDLELNYILTLTTKMTTKSTEWLTILALYRAMTYFDVNKE
jgi:hypothetical protein